MKTTFLLPIEVTRFKEGDYGICGSGAGDTYCDGLTKKQAAFIVRACNSHAALLAALQGVLQYCVTVDGMPDKGKGRTDEQQAAFDAAKKALALAKGDA